MAEVVITRGDRIETAISDALERIPLADLVRGRVIGLAQGHHRYYSAGWEPIHVEAAMLDFDPRTTTRETTSGTRTRRAAAAAAAPVTTSAITTGDNPTLGRATAMMAWKRRTLKAVAGGQNA